MWLPEGFCELPDSKNSQSRRAVAWRQALGSRRGDTHTVDEVSIVTSRGVAARESDCHDRVITALRLDRRQAGLRPNGRRRARTREELRDTQRPGATRPHYPQHFPCTTHRQTQSHTLQSLDNSHTESRHAHHCVGEMSGVYKFSFYGKLPSENNVLTNQKSLISAKRRAAAVARLSQLTKF